MSVYECWGCKYCACALTKYDLHHIYICIQFHKNKYGNKAKKHIGYLKYIKRMIRKEK